MQFESYKYYSAHHPARKINSCDDAQEKAIAPSVRFVKDLSKNSNSILARRRLQAGFCLNPLDTKLNSKKFKNICMSGLLNDMKAKVISFNKESSINQSHSNADYIFVNPSCSPKQRGMKELKIHEFLNDMGIFQINIGIAIKEYKF